jgi:hypothetical protein
MSDLVAIAIFVACLIGAVALARLCDALMPRNSRPTKEDTP